MGECFAPRFRGFAVEPFGLARSGFNRFRRRCAVSKYYWDYWHSSTSTTSTNSATNTWIANRSWTGGTSATTGVRGYSSLGTQTWVVAVPYRVEEYLVDGFDNWSDQSRAAFTRLINEETQTGFKINLWATDIQITNMDIQVRDLDWFLLRVRQRASFTDYSLIADFVAAARADASTAGEVE